MTKTRKELVEELWTKIYDKYPAISASNVEHTIISKKQFCDSLIKMSDASLDVCEVGGSAIASEMEYEQGWNAAIAEAKQKREEFIK